MTKRKPVEKVYTLTLDDEDAEPLRLDDGDYLTESQIYAIREAKRLAKKHIGHVVHVRENSATMMTIAWADD